MGKRINRCIELLEQDQAIYYDGPHSGHVLTPCARPHRCRHLGRLHECRHGARQLRHDGPGGLHARHGRGRPDAVGASHAGRHRGSAGQRHRRRACALQCLAVPPDPRPRRAWHPAVPGRDRGRGARLRRILPLSAQHHRRRSRDPVAVGAHGGRETRGGRRRRRRRPQAARHRHARARIGEHGRAGLGAVDRRLYGALRSLAAQSRRASCCSA